jgi:uncharacterized protein with HEPN domain
MQIGGYRVTTEAGGLRIVLAHHYHRVDPGQVWAIATSEVPRLAEGIRPAS